MKRARGRPRSFNREMIVGLITEEFRKNGFSATSLDDLVRATGLTRPSLYGAFGDKQAMFLLAIDTFGEAMGASASAALNSGATLEDSLSGFYEAILNKYFDNGDVSMGCLVFATAIGEAGSNPKIQTHLHKQFKQIEITLMNRIVELLPNCTANQIGIIQRLSVSIVHSIAIRARTGESRASLEASVNQTIEAVCTLART